MASGKFVLLHRRVAGFVDELVRRSRKTVVLMYADIFLGQVYLM